MEFPIPKNIIKFFTGGYSKEQEKKGDIQFDTLIDTSDYYDINADEKELVKLANEWEVKWYTSEEFTKMKSIWEENYDFWVGNHNAQYIGYLSGLYGMSKQLIDNRLFVALETVLPIAGKQVPEALVEPDVKYPQDFDYEIANNTKNAINNIARVKKLRLVGKRALRNWALYHLGVAKIYYDKDEGISFYNVNPANIIFDVNGYISETGEYKGEYIGERKKFTAKKLIELFPAKEKEIKKIVNDKLGSVLFVSEYWYNDFVFWKYKNLFLCAKKNPYWNIKKSNHFKKVKFPYVFLNVFNLGLSFFDDTGLIQQNIPLQQLLNKRLKQIDKNVDKLNTALVISGDSGLTKAQAREVIEAYEQGRGVYIQRGEPSRVLGSLQVPSIPQDVYQQLQDMRIEIDNIFGTHAVMRGEPQKYVTATGIMLSRQGDENRIGLIADALERFYNDIYNWIVQMLYVFEPEKIVTKEISMFAKKRGKRSMLFSTPLIVSVKENSLLPKDEITLRNTAFTLLQLGRLDPLSAFELLGMPDPKKYYERLIKFQQDPTLLLKEEVEQLTPNQTETPPLTTETPPPPPVPPPEQPKQETLPQQPTEQLAEETYQSIEEKIINAFK